MIAVYYGADEFSAREALAELKAGLDGDTSLADNTTIVDGATARPDELLAQCQTLPFLGSRRLIIVEGLLGRFEQPGGRRGRSSARGRGGGRKASELESWQGFVEALPALPESTALVFVEGQLSAQNPLLAAVRPHAELREFKALPQGELAGWANERARRYGLTLEGRAVASLTSLVGNQLRLLDSELRKLAAYADGGRVTEDDVRELVSLARTPSVFAMADATIEGRMREAEELLHRLLQEGEPPQMLLFMLTRQYRNLLLAKELLDRGTRQTEVGAKLGMPGFALQRLLQQAPRYTFERLRRAYRRLLEADLSIKRGVYDDQTALHLLVFELADLAGAAGAATPQRGRPGYSRPPSGRPRSSG